MKGLISNLVTGILQYETSPRYMRRFRQRLISVRSHFQLRQMARSLAKCVKRLEADLESMVEERDQACTRNLQLEEEIDRLEKLLHERTSAVSAPIHHGNGACADRT